MIEIKTCFFVQRFDYVLKYQRHDIPKNQTLPTLKFTLQNIGDLSKRQVAPKLGWPLP